MDWQPIETAPKDGTAVLLYFHSRTDQEFNAMTSLEPFRLHAMALEIGFYQGDQWCEAWTGHDFFEEWHNEDLPSHWMPCPMPPTKSPATE